MRTLALLVALTLGTPALAAPQRTPLTLLPILAGEGVSEQEVAHLEREVRTAIEALRNFMLAGPDVLPPLGPHCRADLGCVRASLPLARDQLTLDLRVERLGKVLMADLRLVTPSGPIERWRSTLVARAESTALFEATTTLLVPHTREAYLFQRAREDEDSIARDLLLRDYPDSDYARALLRSPTLPRPTQIIEATPVAPEAVEEESPGSPEWIEYLDG